MGKTDRRAFQWRFELMLPEGDVQQTKHTVKELLSPMHVNKLNRCLFWKIWYFQPPARVWVTVGDFYWFSALKSSLCGVMSSCSAGSMWGIERESNSSGLWVITPLPAWRGGERKVGVLNGGVCLTRMYSKTMEPRRRSHSGAETFLHVQLSMCVGSGEGRQAECSCPTRATVARWLVTLLKILRWTRWDLLKSNAMHSGIPRIKMYTHYMLNLCWSQAPGILRRFSSVYLHIH